MMSSASMVIPMEIGNKSKNRYLMEIMQFCLNDSFEFEKAKEIIGYKESVYANDKPSKISIKRKAELYKPTSSIPLIMESMTTSIFQKSVEPMEISRNVPVCWVRLLHSDQSTGNLGLIDSGTNNT